MSFLPGTRPDWRDVIGAPDEGDTGDSHNRKSAARLPGPGVAGRGAETR